MIVGLCPMIQPVEVKVVSTQFKGYLCTATPPQEKKKAVSISVKAHQYDTPSVWRRLVAAVSLWREGGAEGRLLKLVRHAAGVRRVGGGGVGGRVGGVLVWRRLRVGGKGDVVHAVAKAYQSEVGGDSLQGQEAQSRF